MYKPIKSIGQVAYEEWAKLVPSSTNPGIAWDKLPQSAQAGWFEIAQAVIQHYLEPRLDVLFDALSFAFNEKHRMWFIKPGGAAKAALLRETQEISELMSHISGILRKDSTN